MKTTLSELKGMFPAAFGVPLRFASVMSEDDGRVKCAVCLPSRRWYPLEGFAFKTQEDEVRALWLLNWMHWVTLAPAADAIFRAPLVVIDGPPGSGKSTLLKRLAEIAEVPLDRVYKNEVPNNGRKLDSQVLVMEDVDAETVAVQQFGLLGLITAETWQGRMFRQRERSMMRLRSLLVMTGCGVELPPDLEQRALVIRLGKATK